MKMRNSIIAGLMLALAGCETVYHHNTVYQLDAVGSHDTCEWDLSGWVKECHLSPGDSR